MDPGRCRGRRGIDTTPGSFSPDQGLAVLERVVAGLVRGAGPPQLFVHSADWSDVTTRTDDAAVLSLYQGVLATAGPVTPSPVAAPPPSEAPSPRALLEQLAALPGRRRRMVLRDEVRRRAAVVLDVDDPEQIEVGQPLHDMGLDSLMAVELRNSLRDATGADLPATLLFEQPTVQALVDHLLAEHLHLEEIPSSPESAESALEPSIAPVATGATDDATDDVAAALAARLDRLSGGGR